MPNKPKFPSPRFGRRIADALSPRLSVPRVATPWITVQDVDEDGSADGASTGSGSGGRSSGAGALSAFRRRVSSSVSASMRVKKSNRSAGKAANPHHPPPLRTRCKSVSFEVSLIILSDLKELLIRPCTQCVCFGCMIFVGIELTSGQRTINLSQ